MQILVLNQDGTSSLVDVVDLLGIPKIETSSLEDRLDALENQLILSENNNVNGGIF